MEIQTIQDIPGEIREVVRILYAGDENDAFRRLKALRGLRPELLDVITYTESLLAHPPFSVQEVYDSLISAFSPAGSIEIGDFDLSDAESSSFFDDLLEMDEAEVPPPPPGPGASRLNLTARPELSAISRDREIEARNNSLTRNKNLNLGASIDLDIDLEPGYEIDIFNEASKPAKRYTGVFTSGRQSLPTTSTPTTPPEAIADALSMSSLGPMMTRQRPAQQPADKTTPMGFAPVPVADSPLHSMKTPVPARFISDRPIPADPTPVPPDFYRLPSSNSGLLRPPSQSGISRSPSQSGFSRSPTTQSGILRPPTTQSGILRPPTTQSGILRPPTGGSSSTDASGQHKSMSGLLSVPRPNKSGSENAVERNGLSNLSNSRRISASTFSFESISEQSQPVSGTSYRQTTAGHSSMTGERSSARFGYSSLSALSRPTLADGPSVRSSLSETLTPAPVFRPTLSRIQAIQTESSRPTSLGLEAVPSPTSGMKRSREAQNLRLQAPLSGKLAQGGTSALEPVSRMIRLRIPLSELPRRTDINAKAGFILSMIDGTMSIADILSLCTWPPEETSQLLCNLKARNIIDFF